MTMKQEIGGMKQVMNIAEKASRVDEDQTSIRSGTRAETDAGAISLSIAAKDASEPAGPLVGASANSFHSPAAARLAGRPARKRFHSGNAFCPSAAVP